MGLSGVSILTDLFIEVPSLYVLLLLFFFFSEASESRIKYNMMNNKIWLLIKYIVLYSMAYLKRATAVPN